MYANEMYPKSCRIYSRPYACFIERKPEDDRLFKFFDAIHDFGESLIGKPFHMNCDDGFAATPYVMSPFWISGKIALFAERPEYQKYKQTLLPEAQAALAVIVDQASRCGGHLDFEDYEGDFGERLKEQGPREAYDVPALKKAFLIFWQHEAFLDPRVTHAEELFIGIEGKQDASAWQYDSFGKENGAERLNGTLSWMAKPENAKRIALMFLYSRIAQHTGENDPRSFKMAFQVADAIDRGLEAEVVPFLSGNKGAALVPLGAATVSNSPVIVPEEKTASPIIQKLMSLKSWVFGTGKVSFEQSRALVPEAEAAVEIKERAALISSIPYIVRDYKRLCDGSWANKIREERMLPQLSISGDVKKAVSIIKLDI